MKVDIQQLFGQSQADIKSRCVLTPFLTKYMLKLLNIASWKKGRPYASGSNDQLTLIETRIGAPYAGDAVLFLKDTPCEEIIFIGSCGSLDKSIFPVGSIVCPDICHPLESFTQLLNGQCDFTKPSTPDSSLLQKIASHDIQITTLASTGSIALEEPLKKTLIQHDVRIMDMESSAILNAASHCGKKAVALLYVTDLVGKDNPYEISSNNQQQTIAAAQKEIFRIIKKL